jgi:hypothetical protein
MLDLTAERAPQQQPRAKSGDIEIGSSSVSSGMGNGVVISVTPSKKDARFNRLSGREVDRSVKHEMRRKEHINTKMKHSRFYEMTVLS